MTRAERARCALDEYARGVHLMAHLLLHELAAEGDADARVAMSEARAGRWSTALRLLHAIADARADASKRTWQQRATDDDLARCPARVRVFVALREVSDDAPLETLMAHAGVNEAELREAMRDLALRDRDVEA